ncbi:PKD domain-containing protein [Marinilabiliaceae bacterium JC040]|nr:PKD domain-containing protein [Marinilabiliaceae bacterium JC040]
MKNIYLLVIICIAILTYSCSKDKEIPDPKLDFTYQVDKETKTVTFTNTSKGVEDYKWNFGDEEQSSEESPKHTYKTEGTFKLVLQAKSLKTQEIVYLSKEIVVGDPLGHQPSASIKEVKNIDFAGADLVWENINSENRGINRYIEISSDKDFKDILSEYRVDSSTNYKLNDLIPKTNYWVRLKTIFYELGNPNPIDKYSDVETFQTTDMPSPSVEFQLKLERLSYNMFKIIRHNFTSSHLFSTNIKYTLNVYRLDDNVPAIEVKHLFDTYIKEPYTIFIAEYKAEYKGVVKTATSQGEIIGKKFIANLANSEGWDGTYTKKYIQNAKTMLEFGESEDGKKVVFQLNGFKGEVGEIFELKENTLYRADGKNSINTVDDTYAYYMDGVSPYKYYLARQNQRLELYRISDKYYYFRTNSSDDFDMLNFRQDRDDVSNYGDFSVYQTYFVVPK